MINDLKSTIEDFLFLRLWDGLFNDHNFFDFQMCQLIVFRNKLENC